MKELENKDEKKEKKNQLSLVFLKKMGNFHKFCAN